MLFYRGIYMKKVMKLLAFIFEQPSYLFIFTGSYVVSITPCPWLTYAFEFLHVCPSAARLRDFFPNLRLSDFFPNLRLSDFFTIRMSEYVWQTFS